MLTCANCQFVNPADHKFCQRCGEPLIAPTTAEVSPQPALQVRLMPPQGTKLVPATYIDSLHTDLLHTDPSNTDSSDTDSSDTDPSPSLAEPNVEPVGTTTAPKTGRYQVLTVLSEGCAYITDTTPEVRSPLQQQLAQISQPALSDLEGVHDLPKSAYPYLLLGGAAPPLYDAWRQGDTDLLIISERPALSSVIKAFSTAVDPLQPVYWMYRITELWAALAPIPQWRSSLLLADNLGIDGDQSLCVQKFIAPVASADIPAPQLLELKVFLKSLLAQPHRGTVATLRQNRQMILAVSSAQTLEELSEELADIGKALLATPEAITPVSSPSPVFSMPMSVDAPPDDSSPDPLPAPATMPPQATAVPNSDDALKSVSNDSERILTDANGLNDLDNLDDNTPDLPESAPADSLPQTAPADSSPQTPPSQTTVLQDPLEMDVLNDSSEEDESTMVLPMKLVALGDAGQTHVGQQRDHNEDYFLIARQSQEYADNNGRMTAACGLYILCDGMGGHDGGEVASMLAAKTLKEYFKTHWPLRLPLEASDEAPRPLPDEVTMVEAVKLANQAIYEVNEQEQRAGHERMGTTLVVVLLQGTAAVVAHAGDSRLYQHSRRLGLHQVTIDHEVGQREIQRGIDPDEAYARPDAYQLTQALGPRDRDELEPDVSYLNFSEDTLLLLCSDGLSDNDVVEDYLDSHINPLLLGTKDLSAGVNDLVQLSNEVNGHDNITAIAIRLEVSPDLNKGFTAVA